MRVMLATVDFPPHKDGVSTLSQAITEFLADNGCGVLVVAPRAKGAAKLDKRSGFRVSRFPGYVLGKARAIPFALWFARALLRFRPHFILAMNVAYGGLLSYLISLLLPLKYACFAYGYEFGKALRWPMLRTLYLAIYTRSEAIFAVSEFVRTKLVEFGVPPERITVMYPPVDTARFPPCVSKEEAKAHLGLSGRKVVLTVGRLIERKGHDVAIKAIASVTQQVDQLTYLVAGTGPKMDELRRVADELGLQDTVRFLGEAPEDELPMLYRSADVFLFPAREIEDRGDFEGLGIVLLEAAASGVPIVAGRSGGIPEAMVDGRTGFLVDPLSPEEAAARTTRLLLDAGLAGKMGQAGAAWVRKRFSSAAALEPLARFLNLRPGRLKLVMLTRTGRPSGARVAEGLIRDGKRVLAIVAEKRSSLLTGNRGLSPAWLKQTLRRHGIRFVAGRALGAFLSRAREILFIIAPFRAKRGYLSPEELALEEGIRLFPVDDHNAAPSLSLLENLAPDLLVVTNARILSKKVIERARIGGINLHLGKLPEYAGLASIFWSLHEGRRTLGVTVHALSPKLDAGNILIADEISVRPGEAEEAVYTRALRHGVMLVARTVDLLESGRAVPVKQNAEKLRYLGWPTRAERAALRRRLRAERRAKRFLTPPKTDSAAS